jgi:glycosyltransferase involved in cell wall biosynthesis
MISSDTAPLVYSTSAVSLYGTERVTIDTLEAFASERPVVMVAPPGPAVDLARSKGITTHTYRHLPGKWWRLFRLSWRSPGMRLITLSVVDSYLYALARLLQLRSPRHLHVIHGSGYPETSYVSKRYLRHLPVDVVAVSQFAKDTLCAYSGLEPGRVGVIENFVGDAHMASVRPRSGYADENRISRVIVISRLEPPKRVDLMLESMERHPKDWQGLSVEVFGHGPELENLRARAASLDPAVVQVTFHGFVSDVTPRLPDFDLMLHLCPVEPFGIVYLEAMAAGVLVLGPDRGSGVVEAGSTGFLFGADDPKALAEAVRRIRALPGDAIDRVVSGARQALRTRFSTARALGEYRDALEGRLPNTDAAGAVSGTKE